MVVAEVRAAVVAVKVAEEEVAVVKVGMDKPGCLTINVSVNVGKASGIEVVTT